MTDMIATAEKVLLQPSSINEQQLQQVFGRVLGKHIDYADLYFQATMSESWALEDGIVKTGCFNLDRGVGVRIVSGEKTGFAYSDEISLPLIQSSAKTARSIVQGGASGSVQLSQATTDLSYYTHTNPLTLTTDGDKINLLKKLDQIARAQDPRVVQVNANIGGSYNVVLIATSEGNLVADLRPLVRVNVSVVVEANGRREQGFSGGGGRYDYQRLIQGAVAEGFAKEAVRQACVNLDAQAAPAGSMPVVLGSGWPGVLLHEAVGHGLEGDHIRKNSSVFAGRLGEQVASSVCTIVDDGTLPGRRGSLNIDDEGVPSACTTLIEKGILKTYMQDKLNAKLMGMQPTGNGRRESYAHVPMPRMTNTYMRPGDHVPEEIIKSVDKGLYAVNFGGGEVDTTSGKFVFSACEAYMIEKGKVTYPVKNATLIGSGAEVLKHVSMVGNDLALDAGVGVCGKNGQSVAVGVGQPTLKVDILTVGGTAGA